ncbi:DUF397 domain-containing protein [Actinoallomurus liliacearum]
MRPLILLWRKSSRSDGMGGECVEIAVASADNRRL